jgi:hypothetical protein
MNEELFKKILKMQWDILSEDVKKLLLSDDFETKINWISEKYKLSPEQRDLLEKETSLVLVGLEHIMDYTDNLAEQLSITKERAVVIAQEVGMQIFSDVKETIKELGWIIELKRGQGTQKKIDPTIITKKDDLMTQTKSILLKQIENPTLITEHSGTIVDQKLGGVVKIPREEVKIDIQNTAPVKKYNEFDPYREPIQ